MTAIERRNAILSALVTAGSPLTASSLASMFDVSRQIIVGDISILRASGHYIEATSRGYVIDPKRAEFPFVGTVVCRHDQAGIEPELNAIVDNGGTVICTGTPEEVSKNKNSFTGEYLKKVLSK